MTTQPHTPTPRRPRPADLTVDADVLDSYTGKVPRHVAVIMDGNGRWATSRGMPRIRGHHAGADSVRRTVEACRYLGVEVLTLYAFSSQNWARPEDEVTGLMTLFDLYIRRERKRLNKNDVRLKVIGDLDRLSPKLRSAIGELEDHLAHNDELLLQVAVSYGGREEIVRAAKILAAAAARGEIDPEDIDESTFSSMLYTAGQPDPDLVIRTSGELRVSNFLLWQLAYSEFHVTETLWPDFDEHHFVDALNAFGHRERRFGKTSAQV